MSIDLQAWQNEQVSLRRADLMALVTMAERGLRIEHKTKRRSETETERKIRLGNAQQAIAAAQALVAMPEE